MHGQFGKRKSNINILIVTNYRTASTSIGFLIAEQYDVPFYSEIFNRNGRYGLGELPGDASHGAKLNAIIHGVEGAFKIMPDQENDVPLSDVAKAVDKVVYLYRRDFTAQAKSWLGMQASLDWGRNGFKLSPSFSLRDLHLNTNLGTTITHHVPFTQEESDMWINQLIQNWEYVGDFYQQYPGEVICMEDYLEDTEYLPYNRSYTWENEIVVPEYSPEDLFK